MPELMIVVAACAPCVLHHVLCIAFGLLQDDTPSLLLAQRGSRGGFGFRGLCIGILPSSVDVCRSYFGNETSCKHISKFVKIGDPNIVP